MKGKDKPADHKKQALKSIILKGDMTREEVGNALSGKKENKHLKLVIGGPNPEKHFLNGAPIGKEKFEGIIGDELKMGIRRTVKIYIDGKELPKEKL